MLSSILLLSRVTASCLRKTLMLLPMSRKGIIHLPLTQEDTLKLTDDEPVWVQLRLRDNLGNAVASEPMRVEVGEVFKDGVI